MHVFLSINIFPKESLESKVRNKTDELKTTSAAALEIAREIHDAHKEFAKLVVTKLKGLSESGGGTLLPDSELNGVWTKVEVLSSSVTKQTKSLRSSILDLSHLINQAKDKYESRHFRKKLWEWLVQFFDAIANALGIVRHGIAAVIGGTGIIGAAVGVNSQSLVTAAAAVCKEIKNFSGSPTTHALHTTEIQLVSRFEARARVPTCLVFSQRRTTQVYQKSRNVTYRLQRAARSTERGYRRQEGGVARKYDRRTSNQGAKGLGDLL